MNAGSGGVGWGQGQRLKAIVPCKVVQNCLASKNSKFEPGLIGHYDHIFVRVGRQTVTVCILICNF